MIEEAYSWKEPYRAVGIREVQKSLDFSVKQILVEKINKFNLNKYFDVQTRQIKCLRNDGIIIFQGMQDHTADTIKSLQGFHRFWAEEAQSISVGSLRKLRPTLRESGSQFWASWNPESEEDAIEFLRDPKVVNDPEFKDYIVTVEANFRDNPWFNEELELERKIDLRRNKGDYDHIWEGKYLERSEAAVFHNWEVAEFESPDSGVDFLFGSDFGFAKDPAAIVRCFIDHDKRKLYIDHEAYKVGVRIEDLPAFYDEVPLSRKYQIRADSSRPETIDYLQRNGFPRIVRSTKGPNSVYDGVEFIKSYDVVIHPRCKHTATEFRLYKHKIDKKTEKILPELEDEHNHIIDALRYALELERKAKRQRGHISFYAPKAAD